MQKNLRDYLKVYKNFIDPNVCISTVKNLQKINWKKHSFYNPRTADLVSYNDELSISYEEAPETQILHQLIWDALQQYVIQDLKDCHDWFNGWNGYSHLRFNKYDPTTKMKLHCDHIYSLFDGERKGVPILTILGALNNNYTGGEFIMWDEEIIELTAGSVAIFPSNFLYPHEVKPVKSGVRYSFVSWAW